MNSQVNSELFYVEKGYQDAMALTSADGTNCMFLGPYFVNNSQQRLAGCSTLVKAFLKHNFRMCSNIT